MLYYYWPLLISFLTLLWCYLCVGVSLLLGGELGLLAYSVVALLTANLQVITAAPFWSVADQDIVVMGSVVYCSLYLVNDLTVECFGARVARKMIWLTMFSHFILIVWMHLLFQYPIPLEKPEFHQYIEARSHLEQIFTIHIRLFLAGQVSYWVSQWLEVAIFSRIRQAYPSVLWIRAFFSVLSAMLIDTVLFNSTAFILFSPQPIALDVLWSDYLKTNSVIQLVTLFFNVPVFYVIVFIWRRFFEISRVRIRSLSPLAVS